jgi:hypothetical protein
VSPDGVIASCRESRHSIDKAAPPVAEEGRMEQPSQEIEPSAPTVRHDSAENGHAGGNSTELFSKNLLEALLRFREGDFGTPMPSDLVGIEGKIADVFNDILAVSSRRTAETARVCRVVGTEGKLKERLRVPGAVGGWADETNALNTLIDDLVWPTTEVTRAVGAVDGS